MTQLSNVPMQPKPDAVERPMTLIEKLEQEVNRLLELKAQEKPHNRYGCGVLYLVGII